MSTHAAGTFEIESWDEKPYEMREGTLLTRTRLTKTFSGDVEGESIAELLMAYGSEEGSAAYVGLERVTGRVYSRFGSFVLWHNAAMERGEGRLAWMWWPNPAQASCAPCAVRRGSAWSPEADTLLRSTTTSSNESTLTEAFVGHRRTTAL